jgi:hypothetical protein
MSKQKLSDELQCGSHSLFHDTLNNHEIIDAIRDLEARLEKAEAALANTPVFEDVLMRNQELRAEVERQRAQNAVLLERAHPRT